MLKQFEEKDTKKMEAMEQKLENSRLENIRSTWYFVTSSGKKAIVGSKG